MTAKETRVWIRINRKTEKMTKLTIFASTGEDFNLWSHEASVTVWNQFLVEYVKRMNPVQMTGLNHLDVIPEEFAHYVKAKN